MSISDYLSLRIKANEVQFLKECEACRTFQRVRQFAHELQGLQGDVVAIAELTAIRRLATLTEHILSQPDSLTPESRRIMDAVRNEAKLAATDFGLRLNMLAALKRPPTHDTPVQIDEVPQVSVYEQMCRSYSSQKLMECYDQLLVNLKFKKWILDENCTSIQLLSEIYNVLCAEFMYTEADANAYVLVYSQIILS